MPRTKPKKHDKSDDGAAGCQGAGSSQGEGQQAAPRPQGQDRTGCGSDPEPRGPLTSTRRPILAMCGEQSLTVSSFSICKIRTFLHISGPGTPCDRQPLPPALWGANGLWLPLPAAQPAAGGTRPPVQQRNPRTQGLQL